jgi:type II secretory pathway pseudopilin PulG
MRTTKQRNRREGFTIAELLVAVGVFLVVVTVAVAVFIQSLKAQRILTRTMAMHNNAGAALEQMAREIRTGYRFCEGSSDPDTPSPCNETTEKLTFTNYEGKVVTYQLAVDLASGNPLGTIERSIETPSGSATSSITGPDVDISYLQFSVIQEDGTSATALCAPWRVTIFMGVRSSDLSVTQRETVLQTTMSSRILPIDAPGQSYVISQSCRF